MSFCEIVDEPTHLPPVEAPPKEIPETSEEIERRQAEMKAQRRKIYLAKLVIKVGRSEKRRRAKDEEAFLRRKRWQKMKERLRPAGITRSIGLLARAIKKGYFKEPFLDRLKRLAEEKRVVEARKIMTRDDAAACFFVEPSKFARRFLKTGVLKPVAYRPVCLLKTAEVEALWEQMFEKPSQSGRYRGEYRILAPRTIDRSLTVEYIERQQAKLWEEKAAGVDHWSKGEVVRLQSMMQSRHKQGKRRGWLLTEKHRRGRRNPH